VTELPAHLRRGRQTRARIMDHAVDVATREGLEALTIGRVAAATGLAKASLLGHYGSKEQLQLATLEAGRARFVEGVVAPVVGAPAGIIRLARLVDRWVAHVAESEGGCFLASVAAEFDGRPGPVRERAAEMVREWLAGLALVIDEARRAGHLDPEVDPDRLAFTLHGAELAMNLRLQLLGDAGAVGQARSAMHEAIRAAATPLGAQILSEDT
jgi:AcrR family transcriptional regulator